MDTKLPEQVFYPLARSWRSAATSRRTSARRGPVSLSGAGEPGLVTVILRCHNTARFLANALHSILGQDYRRIELIAVDDGSQDATAEILHDFVESQPERMRLLQRASHDPAKARNLGLQHARGQFIAFLDAEDWWHRRFLGQLVGALESGNAELAYSGWCDVNASRGIGDSQWIPPEYSPAELVYAALGDGTWPLHAAVVRRGLMAALGGFLELEPSAMDDDLWLRASALGPTLVRVPELLAFHRAQPRNMEQTPSAAQVLSAWRARRLLADSCPAPAHPSSRRALRELSDAYLLRQADRALEADDVAAAHRLYRTALTHRILAGDLRDLLPALLPRRLYAGLARGNGARRPRG